MQFVEENGTDDDADMKVLYNAASMLRQPIGKSKPWCFNGSLTHVSNEHSSSSAGCCKGQTQAL